MWLIILRLCDSKKNRKPILFCIIKLGFYDIEYGENERVKNLTYNKI